MSARDTIELVGDLADAVKELERLLDGIYDGVTKETWGRIERAFPAAADARPRASAELIKLRNEMRDNSVLGDADYLDPDRLREDRDEARRMDADAARSGGNDE